MCRSGLNLLVGDPRTGGSVHGCECDGEICDHLERVETHFYDSIIVSCHDQTLIDAIHPIDGFTLDQLTSLEQRSLESRGAVPVPPSTASLSPLA